MNDETLKALRDSIAHWEDNVAAETPSHATVGRSHCALCCLFHRGDADCWGCPVSERTGASHCALSPYGVADDAYWNWRMCIGDETRKKWRAAAQAELDFLKSLLPEG